ncbi:MAG: CPBP family intramembrane metalloprotease [Rhizobiaceae bacterium]|nr:CPBP family intramembrane metalloprotease [Rhizobiaceae bacterium]MCV0406116.1 CPBP family intramembrane metalloprotease [Rhizobiaceae bacterium]
MRYLLICLFIVSLLIPVLAVEWLFTAIGSGLSVTDTRGAGQVSLFVIVLAMVMAYAKFVAGEEPLGFFGRYLREWKRALAGFAVALLFASLVVLAGYLGFAAMGSVGWSEAGFAAMSWKIAERTVVALFVVVVLATSEEILFRVFLMRYLRWNTTIPVTIAAVVFSSLVFAAVHNLTDPLAWFTPEQFPLFVGLFILGVLLCVTYLVTGSFLCAVGIHAGLLGSKVFLRKTNLVEVDPQALFLQDSYDLRMSPIVWGVFAGMAVAILLARHWLYPRFAIERPVVSQAHRG